MLHQLLSEEASFNVCFKDPKPTNCPFVEKQGVILPVVLSYGLPFKLSQGFIDTAEFLQDLLNSRATNCHSGHSLKLHTVIGHNNTLVIIKDNYPAWQISTAINGLC